MPADEGRGESKSPKQANNASSIGSGKTHAQCIAPSHHDFGKNIVANLSIAV